MIAAPAGSQAAVASPKRHLTCLGARIAGHTLKRNKPLNLDQAGMTLARLPSSPTSERMILAVRSEGLDAGMRRDGLHQMNEAGILERLSAAGFWIGPRAMLESSEQFRQIIPYVALVAGSRVVCYDRSSSGGEARLHGKASIGVGGHIDFCDVVESGSSVDLSQTLRRAAQREVVEEVGQLSISKTEWVGVIVENDTPVSRVHIGLAGIWAIEEKSIAAAEDALANVRLLTIGELKRVAPRMETWSAKLLPYVERFIAQTSKPPPQSAVRRSAA